MLAFLPIALFAITAAIVAAVLADAFARFGNAWGVARRELVHIDADLTFETRQLGQVAALRRPARHRPIATVSRLAAWRAPLACAA
jgi:hypothetical protein